MYERKIREDVNLEPSKISVEVCSMNCDFTEQPNAYSEKRKSLHDKLDIPLKRTKEIIGTFNKEIGNSETLLETGLRNMFSDCRLSDDEKIFLLVSVGMKIVR